MSVLLMLLHRRKNHFCRKRADNILTNHLQTPIRFDARSLGNFGTRICVLECYWHKILSISLSTFGWHIAVFNECQLLKHLHGLERACQMLGEAEDSETEFHIQDWASLSLGLYVAADKRRWGLLFSAMNQQVFLSSVDQLLLYLNMHMQI